MNVKELNRNQIDELKGTYLYDTENEYTTAMEVPDEVIFNHFDGILFTNDDFGRTAGE